MNIRILCVLITWIHIRSGSSYINYVYLGCYTDDEDRMLDVKIDDGSMTFEFCYKKCSKYSHFGMQNRRECFCGHSTEDATIYPRRPENECNMACAGNTSQTCGGFWRISVYRKVLAMTTSAANTVTTSLPDFTSSNSDRTVTVLPDLKSSNTYSTIRTLPDLTSSHTDSTVTTLPDSTSLINSSTVTTLHDLTSSNTDSTSNSCKCQCSNVGQNKWLFLKNLNLTMQEIKVVMQPELEALEKELRVKKTNTSRLLRSKTSASDDRISSIAMGYAGVISVCVVLFVPVLQDILRCVYWIYFRTKAKCLKTF